MSVGAVINMLCGGYYLQASKIEALSKTSKELALAAKEALAGWKDEERRANTLCKAIQFALDNKDGEGLEWLRDWFEGEPTAMAELDAALSPQAQEQSE